ncbi:MAG TPA: hypothetical protein VMA83_05845 [Solirubrobacteraceae bacterium]|nr:hypothetical protein [Solirubrobacteraceae bacterium]
MAAEEQNAPFTLAGPKPQPGEETPEVRRARGANALSVAARLMAGAMTFFFLSFGFAFVYLKTSNIEGKWRPANVAPIQSWGVVFVVCLVLSAIAIVIANRRQGQGKAWLGAATACLVLGLLAIIAQILEYTQQTFGPTNYAYASVFIGWTGFYILVMLMSIYWIEIQVATEARELREQRQPHEGKIVYEHPDRLLPRGLDAAAFFWTYLVGLGVIMWVLVYLVK